VLEKRLHQLKMQLEMDQDGEREKRLPNKYVSIDFEIKPFVRVGVWRFRKTRNSEKVLGSEDPKNVGKTPEKLAEECNIVRKIDGVAWKRS
jgi:hypothetical protein